MSNYFKLYNVEAAAGVISFEFVHGTVGLKCRVLKNAIYGQRANETPKLLCNAIFDGTLNEQRLHDVVDYNFKAFYRYANNIDAISTAEQELYAYLMTGYFELVRLADTNKASGPMSFEERSSLAIETYAPCILFTLEERAALDAKELEFAKKILTFGQRFTDIPSNLNAPVRTSALATLRDKLVSMVKTGCASFGEQVSLAI